jgi:tetratricopeptide (TPR) repeat protein/GT2 family glycosyltransferase
MKPALDRQSSSLEVSNSEVSNQKQAKENSSSYALTQAQLNYAKEASLQIDKGDRVWEQGNLDEAIACYRQAIKLAPRLVEAHHKIALALKQQGNLEESSKYYRQAIALNIPPEESAQLASDSDPDVGAALKSRTQVPTTRLANGYSPSQDSEKNFEAAQIYLQQALAYCEQRRWEQVIAACESAVEIMPNLATAYKIWGNALQKMGKAPEALGYYAKALEIEPNLAEAYANVGSLYAGQQKWQQAIDYFQKAISIDPKFAGAYRNLAKVWENLGNGEKARDLQISAIGLEPEKNSASEHFQIGNSLLAKGNPERAAEFYRHAIKLDPNFKEAYQQLVKVLENLGEWQEVADCYRQLLRIREQGIGNREQRSRGAEEQRGPEAEAQGISKIANTKPSILRDLPQLEEVKTSKIFLNGTSEQSQLRLPASENGNGNGKHNYQPQQQKSDRWEDVLAASLNKVRQQPDSPILHANLGTLYVQKQRWQEAIACYQTAIELNPNYTDAYCYLAKIFEKTKQVEQALSYWYQAYTLEPDRFAAQKHTQLGNLLAKQGKLDNAIACYRRALKLKPTLTEAYLRLGEILNHQGQKQEAISCYQQGIKHNPQNAEAHYLLGQAWMSLQEWKGAIASFQQAIKLQQNYWEAYHNLGDALVKQEKWQEAIAAYRQAIKINPQFSWSYNNLGDVLLQLQQWQEAVSLFQRAIELNPDFAWSYYNLGEAFSSLKQWQSALTAYRQALAIQPDLSEIEAKINQILNFKVKAELGSAFECYLKAIEQDPTDLESYHKALEIQPDRACLWIGLANAYLAQGESQGAVSAYQKAIAIEPQLLQTYPHLEQLRQRADRDSLAIGNSQITETAKVFLYPDYRKTNPYQNLLYCKLPQGYSLHAGTIDEAIAAQQVSKHPVIFHLHWTSPITAGNRNAEEFDALKNAFLEKLLHFAAEGGVLIWTVHNLLPHDCLYPDKEIELRNAICRIASKIHIHSAKSIPEVQQVLDLPLEKVQIVVHGNYLGVQQNYVSRAIARQRFGFSDTDVVFLFIGQIRPYKGIDDLFSAFVEIQKDFPSAHLLIAGNPVHPIRKEAISARARLFRNITVIEQHLPDDEMQWFYNAADAVVLPYRQILTSGSVLNALSFSRPVIAPRVGMIEEIVRDGDNGFLYELGDVKSLAKAMARMARTDLGNRDKLFLEARQSIESYTWEQAANQLLTEINSPIQLTEIAIETETVTCKIWKPIAKTNQEGRVAILILNYIGTEDTIQAVQSLLKSSYQNFEIIIIDNDSPNISFRELIQCLGDRTIIRSPQNLGYAGGNNLGIEYVKDKGFEFIWVLNPDTTVEETTLLKLVEAAQKRKDISIYGSTICWSHRPDTVWFAGGVVQLSEQQFQTYHMYNGQHKNLVPDRIYDVDYVTGASIFCRPHIFSEVGLIPERYFLYFEETDWCLQARQKGHRVAVVPDSVLYHAKRSQVDVLPTKIYFYYYIRGSVLFMLKYFSDNPVLVESSIQEKFIQPWLQKIRDKAPKQAEYFAALAQQALKDGFDNITGVVDLLRVFEASESRFLPQAESPILGCLEVVNEQKLSGWVWNRNQPFERLEVTLKVDDQTQTTTLADRQVESLMQQGYGDGNYGFELRTPAILFDGCPHKIEVFAAGVKLSSNSLPVVQFSANPPAYKGRIDGIEQKQVRGWALDLNNPHRPVTVEILDGDRIILQIECNLDRPDLLKAGLPSSVAGFCVPIPVAYCDGKEHCLSLRIAGEEQILSKRHVKMSVERYPLLEANSLEGLWQWLYHYREVSMVHSQNRNSTYLQEVETFASSLSQEYGNREQDRLVSIIMPAYNRETTITAAIESVIAQTYQNWELIIVDDCSSDETVALVQALADRYADKRIILIPQQTNGGVSRSRNTAMQAAQGEIFAYLDSDNDWDKDFLLVMVNVLLDNPWAKIAYCGDRIWQHYPGNTTLDRACEIASLRLGHFNKSLIENRNYIDLNVFVHWREVYEQVGGFREDMRRLVDWELIARYTDYATPKFVPALLVNYHMGYSDNQITKLENYVDNFLKMKQTLEALGTRD